MISDDDIRATLREQEYAKVQAEQEAKPNGAAQCESATAAPESIAAGWRSRLLLTKYGAARAVVANAIIALRHAPEWQGVLHFNESSLAPVAKRALPFEGAPIVPFRSEESRV